MRMNRVNSQSTQTMCVVMIWTISDREEVTPTTEVSVSSQVLQILVRVSDFDGYLEERLREIVPLSSRVTG